MEKLIIIWEAIVNIGKTLWRIPKMFKRFKEEYRTIENKIHNYDTLKNEYDKLKNEKEEALQQLPKLEFIELKKIEELTNIVNLLVDYMQPLHNDISSLYNLLNQIKPKELSNQSIIDCLSKWEAFIENEFFLYRKLLNNPFINLAISMDGFAFILWEIREFIEFLDKNKSFLSFTFDKRKYKEGFLSNYNQVIIHYNKFFSEIPENIKKNMLTKYWKLNELSIIFD